MDATNAQRQARWRQRKKAQSDAGARKLAQAQARIAELENALGQAQNAREKDLVTDLQLEIVSLRRALKEAQRELANAKAKATKPPKPPVDPDSELARRLKGERTKNANLRKELAHVKRWYKEEALRNGKMPLATARAIAMCLHPDRTPSAEERENACKLFNVFREHRD